MTIHECYDMMGGDYDDIIGRLGKENLVETFLYKFEKDRSLCELHDAVCMNDHDNAFLAAHSLKGVAGNLSMTGLHDASSKLTEHLRGDNLDTALDLIDSVDCEYEKVIDVITKYKEEKAKVS